MGGQSSKSKAQIVKDVVNEVIVKNIVNCSYQVTQEQGINVTGSGNVLDNIGMKQSFMININCANIVKSETTVQNDIADKIVQSAAAQGEVLVGALGRERSEVKTDVLNKIKNQINKTNIMNCMNAINAKQVININGNNNIIQNVTLEQHQKMVSDCIQNLVDKTELMTDLQTEVKSTSSAIEMGLFGWLTSGYGMIVLIVLIIVVGGILYYYYSSKSPVSMMQQYQQPQQQFQQPPQYYNRPPPVYYPPQYPPPVQQAPQYIPAPIITQTPPPAQILSTPPSIAAPQQIAPTVITPQPSYVTIR